MTEWEKDIYIVVFCTETALAIGWLFVEINNLLGNG